MPKLYADVIKEAGWCRGVYGAARGVWGERVAHDERDAGAAALSRGLAIWRAPGELSLMLPGKSATMWAGPGESCRVTCSVATRRGTVLEILVDGRPEESGWLNVALR